MSYIPINANNLTVALQNDLQQWRTTIAWAKERYQAYNQNLNQTVMDGLSISAGDQAAINAFIGDLNRFITLAGGTLPGDATDMVFDIQAVLGVL